MTDRPVLVPGTLDMLVLKALAPGPLHGYAIARRIQQLSDDVLCVEEGSLYPALHRMARRGWLKAEWGRSRADLDVLEEVAAQYALLSTENSVAAETLAGLQAELAAAEAAAGEEERETLVELGEDTAETLAVIEAMSAGLSQDSLALDGRIR